MPDPLTALSDTATAAEKILGMFFPDKTDIEIKKMSNAMALLQNQTDINKVEAASTDPLEHWRGGMGWVCVLSYLSTYVLAPWAASFGLHLPAVDPVPLGELTAGMLGLGAMHVYQKVNS